MSFIFMVVNLGASACTLPQEFTCSSWSVVVLATLHLEELGYKERFRKQKVLLSAKDGLWICAINEDVTNDYDEKLSRVSLLYMWLL